MANKGNNRHMKSINAPKYLGIHKKENAYVMMASPGRHSADMSIPLALFVKKEGIVDITKDAQTVIKNGNISVNGIIVTDPKYPIGINDIIHIKKSNSSYRVLIDGNSKVIFEKLKSEGKNTTFKVIRKYISKNGKMFISLHDGSILECSKDIKVNDSIVIDFDRKILEVLPFKNGAKCFVFSGVHVGSNGKIKDIIDGSMHMPKVIILEGNDGDEFRTIVDNVMVVN